MSTDLSSLRTVDGHPFRVLATGLPGPTPTVIFVEGYGSFSLDANNQCLQNPGMSLVEAPRKMTRFFNIYAARDGGFVLGSKSYTSNYDRLQMRDSARALAGVKLTFDDITGEIQAERC